MARPAVFIECKICKIRFKRKRLKETYCSLKCAAKNRVIPKRKLPEKIEVSCIACGKKLFRCPCFVKKSKIFFCNNNCRKFAMQKKLTSFGFKKTFSAGLNPYIRCMKEGKFVYEHRWIMEQHIGRKLNRNEHVHHINGNQKDNRIENLKVISNYEHGKLHFGKN